MATVDPKIAKIVAHMPEVHAAVIAERDRLEAIASGIFASHDNPGGHEITKTDEKVDALVSLEGPDPLAVEFGHWATRDERGRFAKAKGGDREFIEGLHIFGRAIAQASL